MIHTVKGFSVVTETEIDVFLEFPCLLCDPIYVGNLISGSSALSKPSLDVWKFLVCIMLKSIIQDFKHDLTRVQWEMSAIVQWEMSAIAQWLDHSLVLPFLGIGMRIDLFQSCGHCWGLPDLLTY